MEEFDIKDLVQDDKNFNMGTEQGKILMDRSFENFGAGRSVLIDKNNRIIAGNKTAKIAEEHGIKKVRVIETTGEELVVVKRTDIDLDSRKGREMALADNMTSKVNQKLDYNEIRSCVDELQMDTEAWGIKDLEKYIKKQLSEKEKEDKAKERKREKSSRIMKNASLSPIRFCGITIYPTKDEYAKLNEIADEYYEENGVVIGLVGELLGI